MRPLCDSVIQRIRKIATQVFPTLTADYISTKRHILNDLSNQLNNFSHAEMKDGCLSVFISSSLLPYPSEKLFFIRQCYHDIFTLLLAKIDLIFEFFGV
jgi:hypothetical protein